MKKWLIFPNFFYQSRFEHSGSIPAKKIFDQNFLPLSFFCYFGHFGRKTTKSHEKNFTREKIFDFEIFVLKYVSNHSESIPTKKNFRPKFFTLVIFSLFLSFWPKNDEVPRKNFTREKIFDFEIFVLKYVSNHSESIPTKKIFSTKIF